MAELSELVLGVLPLVRDPTSKSLMVSTAAARERLTITFSPTLFSNPATPNKPSNSAAVADGVVLASPSTILRPFRAWGTSLSTGNVRDFKGKV